MGKSGSEQEKIGLAYWYAFTRRPELWGWELAGILAFKHLDGWGDLVTHDTIMA